MPPLYAVPRDAHASSSRAIVGMPRCWKISSRGRIARRPLARKRVELIRTVDVIGKARRFRQLFHIVGVLDCQELARSNEN